MSELQMAAMEDQIDDLKSELSKPNPNASNFNPDVVVEQEGSKYNTLVVPNTKQVKHSSSRQRAKPFRPQIIDYIDQS